MKLFTVDKDKKMVQFSEKDFKIEHHEVELEDLLENNPEYFFENSNILIIGRQVVTHPLPKVDKKKFFDSLDKNSVQVFRKIFKFAKDTDLMFRWGSKGFSLNVTFNEAFVGLIFGYPPQSVFKQSSYTGFEEIDKKVNNSEYIIEIYKKRIKEFRHFVKGGSNYKWIINKSDPEKESTIT